MAPLNITEVHERAKPISEREVDVEEYSLDEEETTALDIIKVYERATSISEREVGVEECSLDEEKTTDEFWYDVPEERIGLMIMWKSPHMKTLLDFQKKMKPKIGTHPLHKARENKRTEEGYR